MQLSLLSFEGTLFILRWLHLFFGVIWIGLLYYFNFVQGSFFAETDAATKSNAIQKLVPRALWWFRWAAMFTMLTGFVYLGLRGHQLGPAFMRSSYGLNILTGAAFGMLMWANVWFFIWPNQKIVIASATQVAKGGVALPQAAAAGARALVVSRTNVMFSIPMLFFMGAASHLATRMGNSRSCYWITFLILLALLELNALKGKTGPMTSVKGVIHCGFGLTLVVYLLVEFLPRF